MAMAQPGPITSVHELLTLPKTHQRQELLHGANGEIDLPALFARIE